MAQSTQAPTISASVRSIPQDDSVVLTVTGGPTTPVLIIWHSESLGTWEPLTGNEPLIQDVLNGEPVAATIKRGRSMKVRWLPSGMQPAPVDFTADIVTGAIGPLAGIA